MFAGERNSFLNTRDGQSLFRRRQGLEPRRRFDVRRSSPGCATRRRLAVERKFGEGRVVAILTKASPLETRWAVGTTGAATIPASSWRCWRCNRICPPPRHPDTSRAGRHAARVQLDLAKYLPQVRFVLPGEAGGATRQRRCGRVARRPPRRARRDRLERHLPSATDRHRRLAARRAVCLQRRCPRRATETPRRRATGRRICNGVRYEYPPAPATSTTTRSNWPASISARACCTLLDRDSARRAIVGLCVQLPSAAREVHAMMAPWLLMLAETTTRTTLRVGAAANLYRALALPGAGRCCALAIVAFAVWMYRRDSVELRPGVGWLLLALRLAALAGLLVFYLASGKADRAQGRAQFARAAAGRYQPEHGPARRDGLGRAGRAQPARTGGGGAGRRRVDRQVTRRSTTSL